MKILPVYLLFFLVLTTTPVFALNGWTVTNDGDMRLYVPENLAGGKVFMYMASGPYELDGAELKNWFSERARSMQQHLGKPLNKWLVKPDKDNWSISNQYVDKKSGNKLSVGYQGGMLDSTRAYITTMVSSGDFMLMLKYGMAYDKVLKDAKEYLSTRPSINNSTMTSNEPVSTNRKKSTKYKKTKSQKIREQIRVAPGKGADLDDIELVWLHSGHDFIMGGFDVDTHLLFEDGTAYKDCLIPPDELDIDASKRLEPQKWTEWRKHWGTYQMKNKKSGDWYDLKGGPGIKAPEGAQLRGQYLSARGSQNFGASKRYITFHDNGRFELSSFAIQSNANIGGGMSMPLITSANKSNKTGTSGATNVSGNNIGGGSSAERKDGSKNTGSYKVNDYTITMVHDNGWRHTELFLMKEQKKNSDFVYKNNLYWLEE